MVAIAILRVEKLKSFGNVGGSEKHTARLQDTPNADNTKKNIRLIGLEDDTTLEQLVKTKIEIAIRHKPRKDAVLCSELFLSASPEYFRPHDPSKAGEWNEQRLIDFTSSTRTWLLNTYGDKCVRAELHLDEATPHIHAYVVPINEQTKLLSHKEMFGGNGRTANIKLSKLQDSYAAAVAPLGIERGVKGSQATHTKVKEYYQAVNSEPFTAIWSNNQLAPTPFESARTYIARIQSHEDFQAINHQLADRKFMVQRLERAEQRAIASEKQRQQLEKRVQLLESQTQQLHDLPLENVAWELGLHHEQGNWKGHGHIINIDGSKFYDFSPHEHQGGGGAIDLVMHVNNYNTKQAIIWLHDRFGEAGAERAAIAKARSVAAEIIQLEPRLEFTPPAEDQSKWQAVHDYLTQQRGLPSNFVQGFHQLGLIYADQQQNAVFLMRDFNHEVQGAYLLATTAQENSFSSYSIGTKRRGSWFHFQMGQPEAKQVQKAVLCSSPLDAFSCAMFELELTQAIPKQRTLYMAIDDPKSVPTERLQHIPQIKVAFNPDDNGEAAAKEIKKILPQAKRLKPKTKDWNERLLDLRSTAEQLESIEVDLLSL